MAHFGRADYVPHVAIGKVGLLPDFGDVEYSVRILDVKHVYGETRALVSPVAGNGSKWVRLERIRELRDESYREFSARTGGLGASSVAPA